MIYTLETKNIFRLFILLIFFIETAQRIGHYYETLCSNPCSWTERSVRALRQWYGFAMF